MASESRNERAKFQSSVSSGSDRSANQPTNSFEVSVRLRPLTPEETTSSPNVKNSPPSQIIKIENNSLKIYNPNGAKREKMYTVDTIFNEKSTNLYIFNSTVYSFMSQLVEGYNTTLFAYGITGAGKTYTLFGQSMSPSFVPGTGGEEGKGIVEYVFVDLFNRINQLKKYRNITIKMSYFEIYNEQVYDLLGEVIPLQSPLGSQSSDRGNRGATMMEDPRRGIQMPEIKLYQITTLAQITELIEEGNFHRRTRATENNKYSSRSHSIIQVTLEQQIFGQNGSKSDEFLFSKLNLIDLAGSEKASKSLTKCGNKGEGMKSHEKHETASINKSLLALRHCIQILADNPKSHIPYRDSKLTRILKDSLGGNTKTYMIACISPFYTKYDQTINTLEYASKARTIKTLIKKNSRELAIEVKQYRNIISRLKMEITQFMSYSETQDSVICQLLEGNSNVRSEEFSGECIPELVLHRKCKSQVKSNMNKSHKDELRQKIEKVIIEMKDYVIGSNKKGKQEAGIFGINIQGGIRESVSKLKDENRELSRKNMELSRSVGVLKWEAVENERELKDMNVKLDMANREILQRKMEVEKINQEKETKLQMLQRINEILLGQSSVGGSNYNLQIPSVNISLFPGKINEGSPLSDFPPHHHSRAYSNITLKSHSTVGIPPKNGFFESTNRGTQQGEILSSTFSPPFNETHNTSVEDIKTIDQSLEAILKGNNRITEKMCIFGSNLLEETRNNEIGGESSSKSSKSRTLRMQGPQSEKMSAREQILDSSVKESIVNESSINHISIKLSEKESPKKTVVNLEVRPKRKELNREIRELVSPPVTECRFNLRGNKGEVNKSEDISRTIHLPATEGPNVNTRVQKAHIDLSGLGGGCRTSEVDMSTNSVGIKKEMGASGALGASGASGTSNKRKGSPELRATGHYSNLGGLSYLDKYRQEQMSPSRVEEVTSKKVNVAVLDISSSKLRVDNHTPTSHILSSSKVNPSSTNSIITCNSGKSAGGCSANNGNNANNNANNNATNGNNKSHSPWCMNNDDICESRVSMSSRNNTSGLSGGQSLSSSHNKYSKGSKGMQGTNIIIKESKSLSREISSVKSSIKVPKRAEKGGKKGGMHLVQSPPGSNSAREGVGITSSKSKQTHHYYQTAMTNSPYHKPKASKMTEKNNVGLRCKSVTKGRIPDPIARTTENRDRSELHGLHGQHGHAPKETKKTLSESNNPQRGTKGKRDFASKIENLKLEKEAPGKGEKYPRYPKYPKYPHALSCSPVDSSNKLTQGLINKANSRPELPISQFTQFTKGRSNMGSKPNANRLLFGSDSITNIGNKGHHFTNAKQISGTINHPKSGMTSQSHSVSSSIYTNANSNIPEKQSNFDRILKEGYEIELLKVGNNKVAAVSEDENIQFEKDNLLIFTSPYDGGGNKSFEVEDVHGINAQPPTNTTNTTNTTNIYMGRPSKIGKPVLNVSKRFSPTKSSSPHRDRDRDNKLVDPQPNRDKNKKKNIKKNIKGRILNESISAENSPRIIKIERSKNRRNESGEEELNKSLIRLKLRSLHEAREHKRKGEESLNTSAINQGNNSQIYGGGSTATEKGNELGEHVNVKDNSLVYLEGIPPTDSCPLSIQNITPTHNTSNSLAQALNLNMAFGGAPNIPNILFNPLQVPPNNTPNTPNATNISNTINTTTLPATTNINPHPALKKGFSSSFVATNTYHSSGTMSIPYPSPLGKVSTLTPKTTITTSANTQKGLFALRTNLITCPINQEKLNQNILTPNIPSIQHLHKTKDVVQKLILKQKSHNK